MEDCSSDGTVTYPAWLCMNQRTFLLSCVLIVHFEEVFVACVVGATSMTETSVPSSLYRTPYKI